MSTFSETIQPVVASHSTFDLKSVLNLLGADVTTELSQLDPQRRAALVDRLVRNLRGMSVEHGPSLERDLLKATGAEPSGTYTWEFATATALVELRSRLRYLATWLGFGWADISRLQAVVCGLMRWVMSSGTGVMSATVEPDRVRFTVKITTPGFDAKTVETSVLVVAVQEVTDDFSVSHSGDAVELRFSLKQR